MMLFVIKLAIDFQHIFRVLSIVKTESIRSFADHFPKGHLISNQDLIMTDHQHHKGLESELKTVYFQTLPSILGPYTLQDHILFGLCI